MPSRPAPTRRQLAWPSAAGRSSGLPRGADLRGAVVGWGVVVRRDDGEPAEVYVAFGSRDDGETWAVESDDVPRHATVPVRFATSRRTRPTS